MFPKASWWQNVLFQQGAMLRVVSHHLWPSVLPWCGSTLNYRGRYACHIICIFLHHAIPWKMHFCILQTKYDLYNLEFRIICIICMFCIAYFEVLCSLFQTAERAAAPEGCTRPPTGFRFNDAHFLCRIIPLAGRHWSHPLTFFLTSWPSRVTSSAASSWRCCRRWTSHSLHSPSRCRP